MTQETASALAILCRETVWSPADLKFWKKHARNHPIVGKWIREDAPSHSAAPQRNALEAFRAPMPIQAPQVTSKGKEPSRKRLGKRER
jgi:hypothetical protein